MLKKCEKNDSNPTLEPIQATVEVGKGTDKSIEEYFTFAKTGRGASTLSCKEGNTQITNVSALALGDHVVKCIATKTSNGKTSAEKQVTIKVKDVKGYNRASGLLFIIYGIIFVILGIPLLDGQNTPYVLLSVIGVMVETIVIMAAYSLVIVKKYEEK